MPPVGQKRSCGNGPAKAFSAFTPPTTSAGKSLAWVIPRSISATRSEAVAVPGRKGTSAACRPSSSVGRRARGDEEARAGGQRVGDLRGRRDRAGADDGAFDLVGDPLDRRQRRVRAQRHLDRRQPAAHERLGQRHGVVDVVDDDDRDDRREGAHFFDGQLHA